MEALIHFIFKLIKISILSLVYTTLISFVFNLVGKYKTKSWIYILTKNKIKFWFITGLVLFFGLFVFMNTHFGNNGLGDYARIPIGCFREISQMNGSQSYIQDTSNGVYALNLDKFFIADDFVYGKMKMDNENYEGNFFIYDLCINKLDTYNSETDFFDRLKEIKQKQDVEFKDFYYHYNKYWNNFRVWLLP